MFNSLFRLKTRRRSGLTGTMMCPSWTDHTGTVPPRGLQLPPCRQAKTPSQARPPLLSPCLGLGQYADAGSRPRPPSKIHGNPATRRGRDGYCRRNAGLVPCARYFVIKSSSHKNLAGATLQGREVENLIACKVLSIEHKAG